ncbi:AMP-binding protein, partial [Escherichia coli]|uniref:AMP-binding protein n=1 Tax=Escherichia coli TaxID=562 RepID=UPI00159BB2E7
TDAIAEKCKPYLESIPSLGHVISLDPATKKTDEVVTFESLVATKSKVPSITPETKDIACLIYTSGTTGNPKGVI